jgi:hypothetical protein
LSRRILFGCRWLTVGWLTMDACWWYASTRSICLCTLG